MPTSRSPNGFTLIELVTTLILIGIVAVVALPRMSGSAEFSRRSFYDVVWSAVSHTRRTAISSRRYACITFTSGVGSGGQVAIRRDINDPDALTAVNCNQNVALPGTTPCSATTSAICAPNGVSLNSETVLIFNPQGQLVTSGAPRTIASNAAIRIFGQPDIVVTASTGFIQ